jgi:hypothetical protein
MSEIIKENQKRTSKSKVDHHHQQITEEKKDQSRSPFTQTQSRQGTQHPLLKTDQQAKINNEKKLNLKKN